MYFGAMKYLEAQFVIFETGSDNTIIKDDLDITEIANEINQFLDSRTIELKNIVQKKLNRNTIEKTDFNK